MESIQSLTRPPLTQLLQSGDDHFQPESTSNSLGSSLYQPKCLLLSTATRLELRLFPHRL